MHKWVLKVHAPMMYAFCKDHDKDSPVLVKGIFVSTFRPLLEYVYGGKTPANVSSVSGKTLIDAANRFGVIGFKLAVESMLVENRPMTVDNVIEWLLFADAMTCPLLMEHATSYFVARAADVIKSESYEQLKESPKLMDHVTRHMATKGCLCFNGGYGVMSVVKLREELISRDLDVDGSKETLIERLKSSDKEQ